MQSRSFTGSRGLSRRRGLILALLLGLPALWAASSRRTGPAAGSVEPAAAGAGEAGPFDRRFLQFQTGVRAEIELTEVLTAGPHTGRTVGAGGQAGLSSGQAGEFLAYGPYRMLPPGLFEVRFDFPAPQPARFTVVTDVVTDQASRVSWQSRASLGRDGGCVTGLFRVEAGSNQPYETRVRLEHTEGSVLLGGVRLRRLGSDETLEAAWKLAAGEQKAEWSRFARGETDHAEMLASARSPQARRLLLGDALCLRAELPGLLAAFAPDEPLQPGAYELRLDLPRPQPYLAVLQAEVSSIGGRLHRRIGRELHWTGDVVEADFSADAPVGSRYEVQVLLERTLGPVTLCGAGLRRLPAGAKTPTGAPDAAAGAGPVRNEGAGRPR